MKTNRQLAAIMFTDIVGYTALMGSDEAKAMSVLKINRTIHKSVIKKHSGKWLKEMGDGTLASFKTISDAVYCAGELISVSTEKKIQLRIAIHQGEVVEEHGDIFGDGVNVASRLEPLAHPDEILVTGPIHRNIKNKFGISSTFVGDKEFKNVDEPIRVYRVEVDSTSVSARESKKGISKRTIFTTVGIALSILIIYSLASYVDMGQPAGTTAVEKSIAVRPFWNESSDKDNEYFVNGMTEDIRNNLAKISDMRVISRGSMEKYRQTELTTKEIAKELDVSYLLEGTVQKLGNQVKIHAQLIHTDLDNHIWEDTYMRDLQNVEEIFRVQSEIAQIIASELNANISTDEKTRLELIPTTDIAAYDYVLKADQSMHSYYMTQDQKHLSTSFVLYNKAYQKDPNFPRAILGMSEVFLQRSNYDSALLLIDNVLKLEPENANAMSLMGAYLNAVGNQEAAFNYYLKAYQLMPNDWWVNFMLGDMYLRAKNDIVNGLSFLQRAYSVNTENRDKMYSNIGTCYFHIGDFEKAQFYFSKALELNLGCASIMDFGWMYHNMGKFDVAIEFYDDQCEVMNCDLMCSLQRFYTNLYLKNFEVSLYNYKKAVEAGRDPNHNLDRVTLACVYNGLGQYQKADSILDKVLSIEFQYLKENAANGGSYLMLASVYALKHDKEKAIENLHKHEEFGFSVWSNEIKIYPAFESLWDEPEFIAIVDRMEHAKAMLRSRIKLMEDKGEINF